MAADLLETAQQFFDPAYYKTLCTIPAEQAPFQHYLETGAQAGLSPCHYFAQSWYEWQNPDYSKTHENGFFHYLAIGRYEGRDPSPLADMHHFAATAGIGLSPEEQSAQVLRGAAGIGCGIYYDFDDLKRNQQKFFDQITPVNIRMPPHGANRRNLVFLQAGSSGSQSQWLTRNLDRNWDVFVNIYDANTPLPQEAEYIVAQAGTKSTAMHLLVSRYANIIRQYDYILFLDDDITVTPELLNQLFDRCAEYKLDLAQMALSDRSNCMWPIFFDYGTNGPRYCNSVEIMMPVLSQRMLFACHDVLGQSVSGFGLDLAFAQKARELGDRNVAVLDNVVAEHLKPIDTDGGALYSYLRGAGINPKAELWHLVEQYDLEKTFREEPSA